MTKRSVTMVIIAAAALLLLLLAIPLRYSYYATGDRLWRVDRLTGQTCLRAGLGWANCVAPNQMVP